MRLAQGRTVDRDHTIRPLNEIEPTFSIISCLQKNKGWVE